MAKRRVHRESILEEAIAQTALEETRRLKDQMAFDHALSQQAEELHQRHHRRVEALIEKRLGRKRRKNWLYLPAAACLALVFWGALQLLRPPQDQVISPTPQVIALTAAPAPTQAPTATALITPSPDPAPVASPTPTVTATVTPTATPTPSPSPSPASTPLREAWQGSFFPAELPAGYRLSDVEEMTEGGARYSAGFSDETGTVKMTFTEVARAQIITPHPDETGFHYVRLQTGPTALVSEIPGEGIKIVWDQSGRTLVLFTKSGMEEALRLANAVQKIN